MATGALDANGIWQYGEDDNEPTFSGMLNKLGGSTSTAIGLLKSSVVQVKSVTKTDTASTSSATYTDITGLSITITPKSASNKILVFANVSFGASADQWGQAKVLRGTTDIFKLASSRFADTNWVLTSAGSYLDSPATTAATTYKIQWANGLGGNLTYLNRRGFDATAQTYSTLTVIEVAG